jgi:DNA polymerase-3 subunit epsilon
MELNLTRPLAFFDLETTGTDVGKDRIVEISVIKILPDSREEIFNKKINPTIPIPPETTKIHGISDEDVKEAPTFKDIAGELLNFLKNCDLAGYNCLKFDVPLLAEEFYRADVDFEVKNRKVIDVQNIFHKMEQRTLQAAYRFYCNKELTNAHSAEADTRATLDVLKAQVERYATEPYIDRNGTKSFPVKNDIEALEKFSHYRRHADLVGHVVFNDKGEEVFNFGKYKGQRVEDVFKKAPQYYDWMQKADFPLSTKKLLTAIKLRGFNKGESFVK